MRKNDEFMDTTNELEYLKQTNQNLVESLNELIALKDATRTILTGTERKKILDFFRDTVLSLFKGIDLIELYLFQEQDRTYVPLTTGQLKPDSELIDWIVKEQKPVTLPVANGRFHTIQPLTIQDHILGMVCLDTTDLADEITPQDLEILSTLSNQVSAALLNLNLQDTLKEQLGLLHNILDSITNGMVTLDMNKRVTRMNRNAMAMLEVDPDKATGKTYAEVLPSPLVATLDEMLHETTSMGFAMERQHNHKLSEGTEVPLAISTSLLRNEEQQVYGIVIIFRDMTASKELERLRRLDQLKSEFVANVSHELKTPLTCIKAYTEALTDMVTEPQQRDFLKVIEEESDRLLSLITDLLNVSRIQSGKLKLNLELTDPQLIVQEVTGISKVQSPKHSLKIHFSEYLEPMLLDKERMKEVMINLISNAIKYSPNGGEVRVAMNVFERNLRIDVTDQGMGISDENLAKIFDQFYRVDSSLTAEISGTGLGLTIVKSIIEAHGGSIRVESKVGAGSTFSILLPIRKEVGRGDQDFQSTVSFTD